MLTSALGGTFYNDWSAWNAEDMRKMTPWERIEKLYNCDGGLSTKKKGSRLFGAMRSKKA